ncbi:CBD9-like protein [Auricularia subglabra TFB-10046 SS5]|nr:CBD9-like protein [Auricularia subglabra TFB-10046 SS5]
MRVLVPALVAAACAGCAAAQYDDDGYGGGGYGGGDDDAPMLTPTPSSTSNTPLSTPLSNSASGSGSTGGRTCVQNLMCISAVVNSTTTTYQLIAQSAQPGWMAIGFGSSMVNTPMVIMWKNDDGSVTLSQRQAGGEVMPTVVPNPPRAAAVDTAQTSALASLPTFAFSIPTVEGTRQNLIWAFGSQNPGSSAEDAFLQVHRASGPVVLDVSQAVGDSGSPTETEAESPPLTTSQKFVVAHAILFALAFMLLLPVGALFARLLRTSSTFWFKAHWIVQFYLTAPVIIIAFAFSVTAVQMHGGMHFNTTHKKLGLAICIIYVVQCTLGAVIHFVKDPNRARRPPQNYFHAILGLATIALALAQVRSGYAHEWTKATGREISGGINIVWIIWVVLLPVLYFGGLAFLPKQFRQEREARERREVEEFAGKRHNRGYSDE